MLFVAFLWPLSVGPAPELSNKWRPQGSCRKCGGLCCGGLCVHRGKAKQAKIVMNSKKPTYARTQKCSHDSLRPFVHLHSICTRFHTVWNGHSKWLGSSDRMHTFLLKCPESLSQGPHARSVARLRAGCNISNVRSALGPFCSATMAMEGRAMYPACVPKSISARNTGTKVTMEAFWDVQDHTHTHTHTHDLSCAQISKPRRRSCWWTRMRAVTERWTTTASAAVP